MLRDKKQLLANFNCNPPAPVTALQQLENSCGFKLPDDYVEFLQEANGGEGFIGSDGYIILWPIEDLFHLNKAYEVAEYAPGLFLFGSDGGGEAFAFDTRSNRSVVSVPFVGMDRSLARHLGSNFQEFLESIHKS